MRPSLAFTASHEAFGLAMTLCTWGAPECSFRGECMRGGDCFRSEKRVILDARRAILKAAERESYLVASAMRDAARAIQC